MARPATGLEQRHIGRCAGKRSDCGCGWRASVYSMTDGKKIRRTFPTRAAAKAWRDDKLGAATRAALRAPTSTTVRQAAEAFLAGARDGSIPTASGGRYKPATLRGYTVGLTKRVLPALGDRRLSDVQRRDVQDLADRLTAEGLSASTVQNTLDPLRVIFRRAIRREEVTIDPTEGLELRRKDGRRERVADPAEACELVAALPDGERALWACAFYAGLRRGELRALRWEDVDLPGRVIHVCRGWDAIEGEQGVKSAAGNRRVPILDPLAAELTAHRPSRRSARVRPHRDGPVQPGNGAPRRARRVGLEGSGEPGPRRAAEGDPRGGQGRRAAADHAARGAAHLRVSADRRRGERQGAQRDHGALHDLDDVRHVRPPDARRDRRGRGGHKRLPGEARGASDAHPGGVTMGLSWASHGPVNPGFGRIPADSAGSMDWAFPLYLCGIWL